MPKFSIERNELDYILTDLLPNEIPEIFTNINFYNYLIDNKNVLDVILKELKQTKLEDKPIMEQNWASIPFNFYILKRDGSSRKMSLVQPLSMLNIYFFISIYKKSVMNELSNPSFSIRYHTKNNKLFYRSNQSRLVSYIYRFPKNIYRRTIEQSGSFFKIKPYNSIIDFTNSYQWEKLCMKYKYMIKLDYKSCFDSIYTHTYNWNKASNVNEAKFVQKTNNVFPRIDRLLQNVNGKVSNGIIVGPEFSRMIAEILLQKIDDNVLLSLNDNGYKRSVDYNIYRYVDDIFVFTNDKNIQNKIVETIEFEASKVRLHLNTLKKTEYIIPFSLNSWNQEINVLKDYINVIFRKKEDNEDLDYKYKVKYNIRNLLDIRNYFEYLIINYPSNKSTIVAFTLSIFVNKITERNKDLHLFQENLEDDKIIQLLDLIFKIYSYDICFENTQRIISILYSFNYDLNFEKNPIVFQKIILKYSDYFKSERVNEYINLLLIMPKYNTYFPINVENGIIDYVFNSDNPILIASLFIYSKYNKNLFLEIKNKTENILQTKILDLRQKANNDSPYLYGEFWYILIFMHCPFIDVSINNMMESFVRSNCIKSSPKNCADKTNNLISDFLLNNNTLFITWSTHTFNLDQQIAYRTFYKTIFRNYSRRKNGIITSID